MDSIPFSLLALGFLLGIKHAFDADHVAAVSTIVARHKSIKFSSLIGAFWGFGHTLSLFIAGFVILLLKVSIPEKVALSIELIVGIMLILLGVNSLIAINKERMHRHKHEHFGETHIHFHSHKITKKHDHLHHQLGKSLLIGSIHGLAGSAALTLIILATTNSIILGLSYILFFGIGSVAGMIIISSAIALPFALVSNKFQSLQKILGIGTGLISIVVGLIVIHDIGLIEGLLK